MGATIEVVGLSDGLQGDSDAFAQKLGKMTVFQAELNQLMQPGQGMS